jgi:fatty acid desaturase
LFSLLHEAVHGLFHPKASVNRWAGRIAAAFYPTSFCIQKKKGMLSAALSVRLASWLFRSFLKRDVWVLDDLRFHGPGHEDTLGDQIMNCVLSHLSTLPAYRSFSHVISPRVPAKKAG